MNDSGGWRAVLAHRPRTWRLLTGLLVGAIMALGQPPFGWPWVAFTAIVGAFLLWRSCARPRLAAAVGWAVGLGYFTASMTWLVSPFMVDAARDGWMAPFALFGMGAGLGAFWALAFGVARWMTPKRGLASGGALVVCLGGAEALRSYVLTGFPWGLPGYIWLDTGLAQFAAVIGPLGLTVATFLFAGGLEALLWVRRGRWPGFAVFAGIFAALMMLGNQRAAVPADVAGRPVVRMVQPNAPQNQKWEPDMIPVFFRRQLAFTAAASTPRPALTVWPETSVPWLLSDAREPLAMISRAAGGRPVIVGIQRREGGRAYNSLALLGANGAVRSVYDKYHLVPFGEYMPLGSLAAKLGIYGLAAGEGVGYTPGTGPKLLTVPGLGRVLPLICYEAIFPQDVNAAPTRPGWLLQITNDAWFGGFSGPYQHFAQARFRAIEQGLPMVRVANTGVSAMIGPRGRVLASLPLGQAGYLDAALPRALAPTLYSRTGDWPLFVLLLMAALYLGFTRLRNSD